MTNAIPIAPITLPTSNELFAYRSMRMAIDSIKQRIPDDLAVESQVTDKNDAFFCDVYAYRQSATAPLKVRIASIRVTPKLGEKSTSILWARVSLVDRLSLSPPIICPRCRHKIDDRYLAAMMDENRSIDRCKPCEFKAA